MNQISVSLFHKHKVSPNLPLLPSADRPRKQHISSWPPFFILLLELEEPLEHYLFPLQPLHTMNGLIFGRSTSGKSMQLLRADLGGADGFHSSPMSLIGYWSHIDQVPSDPFSLLIVLRLLKSEEFRSSLG